MLTVAIAKSHERCPPAGAAFTVGAPTIANTKSHSRKVADSVTLLDWRTQPG
jgi:hypothetical protein